MAQPSMFLALIVLAGCHRSSVPDSGQAWDAYVGSYLGSYFAANPVAAVGAGRHELDGKLPDWSCAGIQRQIERLRSEHGKAAAFEPTTLDERRRFEREYLLAATALERMADEAVEEHERGLTTPLDPDQL